MSTDTFSSILDHLGRNRLLPKSGCVNLYNWGEPLLHPQINEMLKVIREHRLQAHLSTNLFYLPELTRESLSALKGFIISLSGFSQTTYGYIHGKSLTTVLRNVDRLQQMLSSSRCKWKPVINWHRYRFNEVELETAKAYFKERGIPFRPTVAHLNDMKRTNDYFFENNLPASERTAIEKDLFTEYLKKCYLANRDIHYQCPQWPMLSIDENANLLICCGLSNEVEGVVLGSIFNFDSKNIESKKRSFSFCDSCLENGMSKWVHSQENMNRLVRGLMVARNFFDRLGLTSYIPERGQRKIYSLVTNLIIKSQMTSPKK